jgi:hypothetical protein
MDNYQLRASGSGKYQQFSCDKLSDNLVRSLTIYGFSDSIEFSKKNKDGSRYGSMWSLNNMGCFPEIGARERLKDLSLNDVRNLATRISRLLFDNGAQANPILEELIALHAAEKKAVESGKVTFPEISKEELSAPDSW